MKRSELKALKELCEGVEVASSRLGRDTADELRADGMLTVISHKSRMSYKAMPGLRAYLAVKDARFRDIDAYLGEEASAMSRSELVSTFGDSKTMPVRSCPGFPVNSIEPVACRLCGREVTLKPSNGCFVFITDWESFSVPEDVLVVGVENMENFRLVSRQRKLFSLLDRRMLFVSRYPQSGDLVSWLQRIPNEYLHFGDLDLAGVNIYLTEFYARLGERASFFIPPDASLRISRGSTERYLAQYARFGKLQASDARVQPLLNLIHHYRKGYDQEGYVE